MVLPVLGPMCKDPFTAMIRFFCPLGGLNSPGVVISIVIKPCEEDPAGVDPSVGKAVEGQEVGDCIGFLDLAAEGARDG